MVKLIRPLSTVCPSTSSKPLLKQSEEDIWGTKLHWCGDGLTTDALTGAKLASVGFVTDRQKNRRLQLHNPDESVGFDNTSKMYVLPLSFMTEADDIGDL
jgi:hypothetical protein